MAEMRFQAGLVGRSDASRRLEACLAAGRNVLLEGPVGVGKTHLALAVAESCGGAVFRVDGDGRYTEQKLTGWFDPPIVVQEGYGRESFVPGPLVQAMSSGGLLLVNELNRMPEGVQNVLLPAIDERWISVPRLGEIRAKDGFAVIATQNPHEFVATSHLSEALLDRFELIELEFQSADEETEIVLAHLRGEGEEDREPLARAAVAIARATRGHPSVRRGASVRAAIAIAEVAAALRRSGSPPGEALAEAAALALPTRIELERDCDEERGSTAAIIAEIAATQLVEVGESGEKKAPRARRD